MGTFCYYHVPGENGERLRLENAEALQVCRQSEPGKNIAYYYPDAAESYACYLRECGDEHSAPGKDTGNRINLKTTYFHYVYGGSGSFNRQPVRAGDCFIAWAGKAHRLCSDPQDPLKFYFVGVGGYDHMRFLKTLGFRETPEIFSCSCEEVRETLIEPVLYNTPQGVNPAGYALGKIFLPVPGRCRGKGPVCGGADACQADDGGKPLYRSGSRACGQAGHFPQAFQRPISPRHGNIGAHLYAGAPDAPCQKLSGKRLSGKRGGRAARLQRLRRILQCLSPHRGRQPQPVRRLYPWGKRNEINPDLRSPWRVRFRALLSIGMTRMVTKSQKYPTLQPCRVGYFRL